MHLQERQVTGRQFLLFVQLSHVLTYSYALARVKPQTVTLNNL